MEGSTRNVLAVLRVFPPRLAGITGGKMELRVKIKMDNAAFWNNPSAAADILRHVAYLTEESERDGGNLLDNNGNTVGNWSIDEDR